MTVQERSPSNDLYNQRSLTIGLTNSINRGWKYIWTVNYMAPSATGEPVTVLFCWWLFHLFLIDLRGKLLVCVCVIVFMFLSVQSVCSAGWEAALHDAPKALVSNYNFRHLCVFVSCVSQLSREHCMKGIVWSYKSAGVLLRTQGCAVPRVTLLGRAPCVRKVNRT